MNKAKEAFIRTFYKPTTWNMGYTSAFMGNVACVALWMSCLMNIAGFNSKLTSAIVLIVTVCMYIGNLSATEMWRRLEKQERDRLFRIYGRK
jgi:Trk-type K+ transport system membrane component